MSKNETQNGQAEVIYGLEARLPVVESLFAAFQHLLAIFVGIVTPPIIMSYS